MIERFQRGSVRGFLHTPATPSKDGIVLAHGAGGDSAARILVAVAAGLCESGFTVLRIDLPFRQLRPQGPPSPATAAADRAGLREAADAMREIVGGRVVLGGHSYGGRQSSMLAAEEPTLVDGLLLLSYPLHPPTKPDQLRTAHFPSLRTPVLFVHGTRDPFGLPEEMTEALEKIAGPALYSEIKGAGHDLKSGKFDIQLLIVQPLLKLQAENAAG